TPPPGPAAGSSSPAALEKARTTTTPRFYFDWERTRKGQETLDAPFTPAVPLIIALDVALGLILDEGLDAAFDRHVRLGRATRAGVKSMGLELASPDEDRAAVVTTVRAPEEPDLAAFLPRPRRRPRPPPLGGPGP